jgi:uncharacterized protein YhaN
MRFESFTLEKYGLIDSRTLALCSSPGLVVIHGPNEAGKSTSLEAISDFLYGVPNNTARGGVFGYDNIRLSASLILADETRLTLKRRKGHSRTLTDENGQAVDEAVLARILGSTGRDRFASLFGLDHMKLRSGGEHLLAADGDIGRLILEAGGGLRTLVETVDDLGQRASGLFGKLRKGDRLFYVGLAAFEAADNAVKQGLMTREIFEQARQRQKAAQAKVDDLRKQQREGTEETLRLGRLARVVPSIRELDRVTEELGAFTDVSALRDNFAACCEEALKALSTAEEGLREAETRSRVLQAKVEALVLPEALLNVEAAIRDAGEKALHVSKARDDRAHREAELAELNDKLEVLRGKVGLASDAELEALAPSPDAIATAQRLATESGERRGKMASLSEQNDGENERLAAIRERQQLRWREGTHEPFGVAVDFANLAALSSQTETRDRQVRKLKAAIDAKLALHGLGSIEELAAWCCPDASVIQAEIDRRTTIETEQIQIISRIASETEKHDNATAEIERLVISGELPSEIVILRAREERDQIWNDIRGRYLSQDGGAVAARPLADRIEDVELKQARGKLADELADRKSGEADRVAALDLAQRQRSSAAAALSALAGQQADLTGRLAVAIEAWQKAWPDAVGRVQDLGRMKALADERLSLLAQYADWQAQADAVETQSADLGSRLASLTQAEAKLGLLQDGSLIARVAGVAKGITIHENAYADFRQDETALSDVQLRIERIQKAYNALDEAEKNWDSLWRHAMHALSLPETTDPVCANEIAIQWATATGLLDGVRLTRTRLHRMDDDEAALLSLMGTIAGTLDFSLPDDAVAAARMLGERLEAACKVRIERDSLTSQLTELTAERDGKKRLADNALAAVELLCVEASCERPALSGLAARCRERINVKTRHAILGETIVKLGDGLSIETLRKHWANRDLDEIKSALQQLEIEETQLTAEVDAALAALQDCNRELAALSASEGINAAVAERERATGEIHGVLERYVEITLAEELLRAAMDQIREQQKDPLIVRAGALFASATGGAFAGIETDIDEKGNPVVVGRRRNGERVPVAIMSDGVRDQLFLSFRIASIEQYCRMAEPLPFIADDLLVHFDDDRGVAALTLLAELGRTTQVLVFTHHRHLRDAAMPLVAENRAAIIDLTSA